MNALTRQQTINKVVKAVQSLRTPEGCTVLKVCKTIRRDNNNLRNYEIRDALRAAEQQNLLQCKRSKYFLTDKPKKSQKNIKRAKRKSIIKNSALETKHNEARRRGNGNNANIRRKRKGKKKPPVYFICSQCNGKSGRTCEEEEDRASTQENSFQDICLPSTSTDICGEDPDEPNRRKIAVSESTDDIKDSIEDRRGENRGIVQRIFYKFLLLPVIDPNCTLEYND
uniref:Uncharacterized protein n=1 Tax=Graphocephala atropunctata TaxID=36148 RepID=A0A1B6MV71_9HEMI